jgi:hypothetical protein
MLEHGDGGAIVNTSSWLAKGARRFLRFRQQRCTRRDGSGYRA